MFDCLLKGFKIFANKKTLIIIVLILLSFFATNYISNYFIDSFEYGTSWSQLPTYIVNYYGYIIIFLILGIFATYFVSNYIYYLIAHTILKSKKKPIKDFTKVFNYTIFMSFVYFFILFLLYLCFLKINFFTIVFLIIVAIVSIVISLVSGLAIMFLPVSKTLKESFNRAWLFLKKKFWLLLVLIILLGIIISIISFAFEYTAILWLSNYLYAELVLQSITTVVLTMYSSAVIVYFLKKK